MIGEEGASTDLAVEHIQSTPDVLEITARFPGFTPESLFRHWTEEDLICQWWPERAKINLRVGGRYHLHWPETNWHLRGVYTSFQPGERLVFTWKWDHEDTPTREVIILFDPAEGGAQLTLSHGPYTSLDADQEERDGHLEGWRFFLPRLQALGLHNKVSS